MVSLTDKNILKALTLQVKTHNYKMEPGSEVLTLIYRLHFKAMYSSINIKALVQSAKGETLLIHSDSSKSHTMIPKTIKWHEIKLPDKWKLEQTKHQAHTEQAQPQAHQVKNLLHFVSFS